MKSLDKIEGDETSSTWMKRNSRLRPRFVLLVEIATPVGVDRSDPLRV